MIQFTRQFRHFIRLAYTLLMLLGDALRFLCLCLRPSPTLAAENLFLRSAGIGKGFACGGGGYLALDDHPSQSNCGP